MNDIYHDPVRQLKYLRQTLSQNKKPLGFFLAAGCPLAVEMPTYEWPLIPDIAGLTKFVTEELHSKVKKKKSKFDLLLEELIKTGKSNPNIEDILSFVRGLKQVSVGATDVRGLTEIDLAELETSICKQIVEKTNVALPNRETPYHQLAQWIHLIDRGDSPIECFTTNYDLLTEQAFEETGVAYFDGFVGSRQPFFDSGQQSWSYLKFYFFAQRTEKILKRQANAQQAHLQTAQTNTQTKVCKRACLPTHPSLPTTQQVEAEFYDNKSLRHFFCIT